MVDPVTAGTFAVAALATAWDAVLKGVAGEAAKGLYNLAKAEIALWSAPGDIARLEEKPADRGRQISVADAIDAQPPERQAAVEALARALLKAMQEDDPAGPVGLRAKKLAGHNVRISVKSVTEGIGADLGTVDARGDVVLEVDGVGAAAKKAKR